MGDFSLWLGSNSPADESVFASRAWNRIQRNPYSLSLVRGSTTLDAQTVRLTYSNEESPVQGAGGAIGSRRDIIVFGVRNHPLKEDEDNPVPDTDIEEGDQFEYLGRHWKITDVIKPIGSIQATGEAMS